MMAVHVGSPRRVVAPRCRGALVLLVGVAVGHGPRCVRAALGAASFAATTGSHSPGASHPQRSRSAMMEEPITTPIVRRTLSAMPQDSAPPTPNAPPTRSAMHFGGAGAEEAREADAVTRAKLLATSGDPVELEAAGVASDAKLCVTSIDADEFERLLVKADAEGGSSGSAAFSRVASWFSNHRAARGDRQDSILTSVTQPLISVRKADGNLSGHFDDGWVSPFVKDVKNSGGAETNRVNILGGYKLRSSGREAATPAVGTGDHGPGGHRTPGGASKIGTLEEYLEWETVAEPEAPEGLKKVRADSSQGADRPTTIDIPEIHPVCQWAYQSMEKQGLGGPRHSRSHPLVLLKKPGATNFLLLPCNPDHTTIPPEYRNLATLIKSKPTAGKEVLRVASVVARSIAYMRLLNNMEAPGTTEKDGPLDPWQIDAQKVFHQVVTEAKGTSKEGELRTDYTDFKEGKLNARQFALKHPDEVEEALRSLGMKKPSLSALYTEGGSVGRLHVKMSTGGNWGHPPPESSRSDVDSAENWDVVLMRLASKCMPDALGWPGAQRIFQITGKKPGEKPETMWTAMAIAQVDMADGVGGGGHHSGLRGKGSHDQGTAGAMESSGTRTTNC